MGRWHLFSRDCCINITLIHSAGFIHGKASSRHRHTYCFRRNQYGRRRRLPPPQPGYKAPAVVLPPPFNWTGFYVGGNIGYSWVNGDASFGNPVFPSFLLLATFSGTERLDGLIGGGQIGYNWQADPAWVLGFGPIFKALLKRSALVLAIPTVTTATCPFQLERSVEA